MSVTQNVLKKTRAQAVVKLVAQGGGVSVVDLASLAIGEETFDRGNSSVTIAGMFNTVDGQANIVRGSNVVMNFAAMQQDKWDFNQAWGFVLNENSNANISVGFSANGTIMLILNKSAGYLLPAYQNYKDYQR